MTDSTLDLLLRPYRVLHVLMHLFQEGEVTASGIKDHLGLGGRSYDAVITRLLELGFIYQREERTFPKQVFVGLTVRGKRTAKSLKPATEEVKKTFIGLKAELERLESRKQTAKGKRRVLEMLISLAGMEFTMGEWTTAELHAKRARDLAEEFRDEASLAKSIKLLGEIHFRKGVFQDAKEEFKESLRLHVDLGDDGEMSDDHYFLGSIEEKQGDFAKARIDFEESARLADSAKDDIPEARANLGFGRILAKEGKYRESLAKFRASIRTFERLGEIDELPRAYANAGSSMYFIDIKKSLKWHEKCIKLSRAVGDARMLGYGLANVAGCYIKMREIAKATHCLDEASEVFEQLDEKCMMASVSIQYGLAYSRMRNWVEAENRFIRAMDVAKKYGLAYELGDALMNCGLMNLERGQRKTAESQLRRAEKIFEKLGNEAKLEKVSEALKRLSR